MDTTQEVFTIPEEESAVSFMKAAFASANNRTIVFKAVRDSNNIITDFTFSLLSQGSIDFFKDNDPTGKTFFEILPDQHGQFEMMKEVVETGVPNKWIRYYPDICGEEKWFSASDAKSGDGIVRIWDDITDRVKEERKLNSQIAKQTHEQYFSLFNLLDEGFCIIEVHFDEHNTPYDYTFIETNTAFEIQTGMYNVIGKRMKDIQPTTQQHWFDLYGNVLKTGQSVHLEQQATFFEDRWYELSAFSLGIEKENKVAVIFNDITNRKKAEKELTEFNARLEQEVRERTEKINSINELLESKNSELEKSNKELESFNYVASHDLQEPLRKIQTFISLLKNNKYDPAAVDNYLDRIASSASRMSALIQDVLIYSRLTAEKQFTKVDLNQVLNNVLSDYELLISEKNAVINKNSLPVINAVSLHMQQLFSNLISNSLKYSIKDPIITITCEKLKDESGNSFTEIVFKDNGIGFEPEYNDLIFKLFQRLHGKKEYGGTGIGLSICKSIMDQHNGSITAYSTPGEGATFTLRFPA